MTYQFSEIPYLKVSGKLKFEQFSQLPIPLPCFEKVRKIQIELDDSD
jgi:restriction endonuclease S subunit